MKHKALSIRQPWAWLIVHGHKPVENRVWETRYRGPLLIHAGKTMSIEDYAEGYRLSLTLGVQLPPRQELDRGGIVGVATLVDCVRAHDSPWFFGPFGFVLADARPLPLLEARGQLNFFDVYLPGGYLDGTRSA